jgi:hypothetical protein
MGDSMKKIIQLACFIILALPAFAAGGACPTSFGYSVQGVSGTLAAAGVTACYYVSKSTGSDTNAGTTESAPSAR